MIGVIMAGGRSSRMGRDKALLPHREATHFLQHAIDQLANLVDQITISGRDAEPVLESEVPLRWLADLKAYRGPAAALANVLRSLADRPEWSALLLIAVDMPGLKCEHLRQLCHASQATPDRLVAAADADGFPQPMPAVYPRRYAAELTKLADKADGSLSRWLLRHDPQLIRLPTAALANINNPQHWTNYWEQAEP